MSRTFLAAVVQRTADASAFTTSARQPPWDELPEPALLSIAVTLAADFPDTWVTLVHASQVCRGWRDATTGCDSVWRALCEASGVAPLPGGSPKQRFLERRSLRGGVLNVRIEHGHVYFPPSRRFCAPGQAEMPDWAEADLKCTGSPEDRGAVRGDGRPDGDPLP